MRIVQKAGIALVVSIGGVALAAGPAFAHQCTNANKPHTAGAQVVFGPDDEIVSVKKGLEKRIEKGIVDAETGEGFHGIIAFDEDGDGEADGHTFIVTPNAEIPQQAQFRGSPDHGIVNICGPEGCDFEE